MQSLNHPITQFSLYMKYLSYFLLSLFLASACQQASNEENAAGTKSDVPVSNAAYFGEKISEEGAVAANGIAALMEGKDSLETKLQGKIVECCKKKGCWMTIELPEGERLRVTFKDYGFFVPKDGSAHGKEAIFEGVLRKETTSIEALRHYAEDGGKSAEEIAKITSPKTEYTFEAAGVIIR